MMFHTKDIKSSKNRRSTMDLCVFEDLVKRLSRRTKKGYNYYNLVVKLY